MKAILVAAAVAVAGASGVVLAQVPAKCAGCHDMEKKKVGPSFKDSAAKYKGNKDAVATIVAKQKEGKGHPKVAGSDDELKAAVEAALSTK
jgi:cytochrome c551/c552